MRIVFFADKINDSSVVSNKDHFCRTKEFINAVSCPSYRENKAYIMTQTPKKEYVQQFWSLVSSNNVTGMVLFGEMETPFWPTELNTKQKNGKVSVELKKEEEVSIQMIKRKFEVVDEKNKSRSILQWQLKTCTEPDSFFSNVTVLNELQKMIFERKSIQKGPILVQCFDGVGMSSPFVVLSHVLEKIRIDNHVDVMLAVLQVRKRRRKDLNKYEYFKRIHEMISQIIVKDNSEYYYTNH